MPNKFAIAAGVAFTLVAIHDIRTQIRARQCVNICLEALNECEEIETSYKAQIKYLCHMIDENEVPVSEFDLIALGFTLQ